MDVLFRRRRVQFEEEEKEDAGDVGGVEAEVEVTAEKREVFRESDMEMAFLEASEEEEKDRQEFIRALREKVGVFEDKPWSFLGDTAAAIRGLSSPVFVEQLAVGVSHVVLLARGGCVWTMGRGTEGQLGLGDAENSATARLVRALVSRRIVSIGAGGWHTAAVDHTGVMFTWGDNREGQLGLGDKVMRTIPSLVEETRVFAPEGAARGGQKAKRGGAAVVSPAWEALKDLPRHTEVREGAVSTGTDATVRFGLAPVSGAIRIVACGSLHTLVVRDSDGELLATGSNEHGECGLGKAVLRTDRLTRLPGQRRLRGTPIVRSGPAARHTVVVVAGSGTVWTCGKGSAHQLGHPATGARGRPEDEYVLRRVESVADHIMRDAACGESHTLLVREDGRVFVMGSGEDGQLGLGASVNVSVEASAVPRIAGVATAVSAGTAHSFALVGATGAAYGWGSGTQYRLGIGTTPGMDGEGPTVEELAVPGSARGSGGKTGRRGSGVGDVEVPTGPAGVLRGWAAAGAPVASVTVPTPLGAFQAASRERERTAFPLDHWAVPEDPPPAAVDEAAELERDAAVLAKFPPELSKAFVDAELLALKRSFDQVDSDGSGSIDVQELHSALQAVAGKERVEHSEAVRLIQQVSMDGDQELSLIEYVALVRRARDGELHESPGARAIAALVPGGNEISAVAAARIQRRTAALEPANLRLEARRVFVDADLDENGTLEPQEIANALVTMGLPRPPPGEARLLALDLAKSNPAGTRAPDGRPASKLGPGEMPTEHALYDRDQRDATHVPHVGLSPWLEYYVAARNDSSAGLLGRAFALLGARPVPRVPKGHLSRFVRRFRMETGRLGLPLGPALERGLRDLAIPTTRRGRALLRGHLDMSRLTMRDTHVSALAAALLAVPVAQSLDLRGNLLTDAGAARVMVLLEQQNKAAQSVQGAGGARRIDDSGLQWLEGYAGTDADADDEIARVLKADEEEEESKKKEAAAEGEKKRKEEEEKEKDPAALKREQIRLDADAIREVMEDARRSALASGKSVEEAEDEARHVGIALRAKQKERDRKANKADALMADIYGDHFDKWDDGSEEEGDEEGVKKKEADRADDALEQRNKESRARANMARTTAAEAAARRSGCLGSLFGIGVGSRMAVGEEANARSVPVGGAGAGGGGGAGPPPRRVRKDQVSPADAIMIKEAASKEGESGSGAAGEEGKEAGEMGEDGRPTTAASGIGAGLKAMAGMLGIKTEEKVEDPPPAWLVPVQAALAMPPGSTDVIGSIRCRQCGTSDVATPLFVTGKHRRFVASGEDELICTTCSYTWTAPLHFVTNVAIADRIDLGRQGAIARFNLQTAARRALRRAARKRPMSLKALFIEYKVVAEAHIKAFRELAPTSGVVLRPSPAAVAQAVEEFEGYARGIFPMFRRDYFQFVQLLLQQRVARGINDLMERARSLFRVTTLPRDAVVFEGRLRTFRDDVWAAVQKGLEGYTIHPADAKAARMGLLAAFEQIMTYFRSLLAHARIIGVAAGQTLSAFITEAGEAWITGGTGGESSRPPRLITLEHPKDAVLSWQPARLFPSECSALAGVERFGPTPEALRMWRGLLASWMPDDPEKAALSPTLRALVRQYLSRRGPEPQLDDDLVELEGGGGRSRAATPPTRLRRRGEGLDEDDEVNHWAEWLAFRIRAGRSIPEAVELLEAMAPKGRTWAFSAAYGAHPGAVLLKDGVRLAGTPRVARILCYVGPDGPRPPALYKPAERELMLDGDEGVASHHEAKGRPALGKAAKPVAGGGGHPLGLITTMARARRKLAGRRGSVAAPLPTATMASRLPLRGTVELRINDINGPAAAVFWLLPTRSVEPASAPTAWTFEPVTAYEDREGMDRGDDIALAAMGPGMASPAVAKRVVAEAARRPSVTRRRQQRRGSNLFDPHFRYDEDTDPDPEVARRIGRPLTIAATTDGDDAPTPTSLPPALPTGVVPADSPAFPAFRDQTPTARTGGKQEGEGEGEVGEELGEGLKPSPSWGKPVSTPQRGGGGGGGGGKRKGVVVMSIADDVVDDLAPEEQTPDRLRPRRPSWGGESEMSARGPAIVKDLTAKEGPSRLRDDAAPGWEVLSAPVSLPPGTRPGERITLYAVFGPDTHGAAVQWLELV